MAGKLRMPIISPALALDPLIHERLRLAILSALGTHGRLTFNEIKSLTEATDGNLSTHTQKLEARRLPAHAQGRVRQPQQDKL